LPIPRQRQRLQHLRYAAYRLSAVSIHRRRCTAQTPQHHPQKQHFLSDYVCGHGEVVGGDWLSR
jgi:hypothetical protein